MRATWPAILTFLDMIKWRIVHNYEAPCFVIFSSFMLTFYLFGPSSLHSNLFSPSSSVRAHFEKEIYSYL
jgi:hypothetical protein